MVGRQFQKYQVREALLPDGHTRRLVICDEQGELHPASVWLASLFDAKRRPNTVRAYGQRVAAYLSWTAETSNWRSISISHLYLWRRVLGTPYVDFRGRRVERTGQTVDAWLVPLRAFYEWADATGHVTSDVVGHMTQMRFFCAGSPAGGEHGRWRRSLVPELRSGLRSKSDPKWISDPTARQALVDLELNKRDRFLVDLLYFTGLRVGEALSLFRADMHLGGAPDDSGCVEASAHFHIGENDEVENDASPKTGPRVLYVNEKTIDSYIDALRERARILGASDDSSHLFVNLYAAPDQNGSPMKYSSVLKVIRRAGRAIDFPLNGPHMLRHTLATRLIRGLECNKVELDVVRAILGHSSLSSTQIYTHDLEREKRIALEQQVPRTLSLGAEF
jgi:integrase/recombinase XerD